MKTLIAAISLALSSAALADHRYDDRYHDGRYYETRNDRYHSRYGCDRCGVVLDINRYGHRNRHSNAGGTVLGALVGGAIGNQVGKGDGRKAATVAGAVIGGVAGNRIDDRNGDGGDRYEVLVRMDDGRRIVLNQNDLNGVREGSRVYVRNGRARLR